MVYLVYSLSKEIIGKYIENIRNKEKLTNKIGGETPKLVGEMHSKNKNHQKRKFSVHFWNKIWQKREIFYIPLRL